MSLFCLIQGVVLRPGVGGGHTEADVHSTLSSSQVWLARVQGASWRGGEHLWRYGRMSQQKLSTLSDTGAPALRDGSLESGLPDSFPRQAFLGVLSDMGSPAAEAWRGLGPDVCSFRTPALLALAPPTCTPNVRRPVKCMGLGETCKQRFQKDS